MNTPFLLTITSGTELLSEHVHLNHQIFMKQLSPQQRKGQILRPTPNTAPLICGACYNTQPEDLLTMA